MCRQLSRPAFVHARLEVTNLNNSVTVLDSVVAMQRIADCVRRGAHWYCQGLVDPPKAVAFQAKLIARYGVNAHRNLRARARLRGEAGALLLFFEPLASSNAQRGTSVLNEPRATIEWILLVEDGRNPAHVLENLQDALDRNTRIRLGGFTLSRRTRPGNPVPAWTWQMHSEARERWRLRVLRSARGDPREPPEELRRQLTLTPGFAGVRSDVGRLMSLLRKELHRRRPREQFRGIARLGYLQRLPNRVTRVIR
jgi:hypothetical protein